LRSNQQAVGFTDGDYVSMETNDGFLPDGQVVFDVDEADLDLLAGASEDDNAL
jgi:hypothetical protein